MPSQDPEPTGEDRQRLEEGLRRLRELGYLQTRAERYVARRVPSGAPTWKVATAVGLWVGIPGGLVFAWILVLSAWLARPELADDPRQIAWLVLDMSLALSAVSFVATTIAAGASLSWLRGPGRGQRRLLTRLAAYVPSLIAGLYLADRIGQHLLVDMSPRRWVGAVVVVAVTSGALASAMTWLQSAMFAAARLQWKRVWDPPRVGWQQRTVPFLLVAGFAALLLLVGPYRGTNSNLPHLDEVRVEATAPGASILLLAIDGVGPEVLPRGWPPVRELRLSPRERSSPPLVFWNEVATGFDPAAEGLTGAAEVGARGLVTALPDQREDPLLSVVFRRLLPGVGLAELRATDRRELQRPQLWEIAAHAGRRSTVINWWATYPAARHPRLEVVSDRYFLRADSSLVDETIASPFGIATQLEIQARSAGLPVPSADPMARRWTVESTGDRRNWSFGITASRDRGRQLVAVLLGGADILARSDEVSPNQVAQYVERLREGLGEFDPGERSLVVLLARPQEGLGRRFWVGSVPGSLLENVEQVRSITPKLLEVLGLPIGRDMVVLDDAGSAPTLPTWGLRPRWSPSAARSSSDLEKLRSLGYIGD